MSYLVLARKYRPRNFSEMVGQEHVVRALVNALESRRLHHAYLFTGTRGVGKTTVSRILAKSLNCQGEDGQGGITSKPCGKCDACRDIDSGRFVDYTELDAASNRSVDEMQALLEQAAYKPVQGRFKVFMIDEVHMLTGHAFNAMLKTLEEPPEYLKFVLATTDPQKVPVTVLSRCLQFNLRPMAPETILEHLVHLMQVENIAAEPMALRLLARAARGSMRDALSLTDQSIAYGNGVIEAGAVRQMLGSVDRQHIFALIDALAKADGRAVVQIVDSLRQQGLGAVSALDETSAVLQRMAVIQADAVSDTDDDPDGAGIRLLANALPRDETQLLYSLCLQGRAEVGLAPDEYSGLVMVFLRLLAFKPTAVDAASEKKTSESGPCDAGTAFTQAPSTTSIPLTSREHALVGDTQGGLREPRRMPAPQVPSTARQPSVRQPEAPATAAVPHPKAEARLDETLPIPPAGNLLTVVERPHPVLANQNLRDPASATAYARHATQAMAVPVLVQAESAVEVANAQANPAPVVQTVEGDFWHELVQRLVANDLVAALVRELALQSQLIARDTDQWLLRVERESLNQSGARERLQAALQRVDHAVNLAVEIGRVTDSPARRIRQAQQEHQMIAERIIFEDPFVQEMMRDFGAKIVPGSIKAIL